MNEELVLFLLTIAGTYITFGLATKWYIWPRLRELPDIESLKPLLLIHSFRTIGLSFLVTGVVGQEMPRWYAEQLAYGDLAAAVLAIAALIVLPRNRKVGIPLVWLMNIVGLADLLNANIRGMLLGMQGQLTGEELGAAFFIPTVLVPALIISHILIFVILVKKK